MFNKHKSDIQIFLFLILLVFIFKFNILNAPLHWDAIGVDVPAAVWMLNNNFSPFLGTVSNGHPFFSYFIIALFFKLFTISQFIARIPSIISVIICLFYTYKIAEHVYNKKIGILASLSLFLMPIFFAQSGLVMSTTFLLSLSTMVFYYSLKQDMIKFSIFSTLLILTRETMFMFIFILIIAWIYRNYTEKKNIFPRNSSLLFIPIIVFLLWIIANKIIFGWFLFPTTSSFFNITFTLFVSNLMNRLKEFFLLQHRVLFSLAILISLCMSHKTPKKEKFFENLISLVIFVYLVFYSLLRIGFLPRYFLFLYPYLIIFAYGKLSKAFSKYKYLGILLFLVTTPLFVISWTGERTIPPGWQLETNMEYIDIVKTHKEASSYIEQRYANETILTCWPMTSELQNTYAGYVKKPVKTQDYNVNKDLTDIAVIYFSVQSNCYNMLNEINLQNFRQVSEYNLNGKIARIYKR